jgi:uncharacterized protein involved in exopolysaccharide biosynthesis
MKTGDPSDARERSADRARFNRRQGLGLLRQLLRRWWVITLLWLVVSVAIDYAIYVLNAPTYEAFGTLRIEPTNCVIGDMTRYREYETRALRA